MYYLSRPRLSFFLIEHRGWCIPLLRLDSQGLLALARGDFVVHRLIFAPAVDIIGRHRPMKALQIEVADVLRLDQTLDRGEDALADQDLAGLSLVAQARCQIDHAPDRGILLAAVESYLPQRGVAE